MGTLNLIVQKNIQGGNERATKERDAKSLTLVNASYVKILKPKVTFYGSDLN